MRWIANNAGQEGNIVVAKVKGLESEVGFNARTDTFENWGDWDDSPGMSMDNFWGGNPLFFDLVPADAPPPVTGPDIDIMVIVAAGVAVAAVVAVAALLLMKKKGGKKEEGESPLGE